MKKMYIVLQDGHIFEGKGFAADGEVTGELVFTTGMVGYIETLTDAAYYGQIVMQTFPLIGNYGMISEDKLLDKSVVNGYVVREWCEKPSNFRCEENILPFLTESNIVSICDVDTREITKIIRENGVMNACITDDPSKVDLKALAEYRIKDAVKAVSCTEKSVHTAENEKYKVAVLDLGAKLSIENELLARGCTVITVPYNTTAEEILALGVDGMVISNGPGDPADCDAIVAEIKKLMGKIPMFGISLGHQLMALAAGAKTEKLKYGHRGSNQPVKELASGKVFVTSQNHGYAVVSDSLDSKNSTVSFINVNDNTCAGIDYADKAFSVQFYPGGCEGATDAVVLYDKFVSLMGGDK
ncbi:MAG: carbamoyl phosphate synthase small subunit [Clostridia bacterium]|nr:carbamoyl phosphate synthase small subunit [Clostridia bacterium]